MNENFATKSDLIELGMKLESSIRELDYRRTIKLGAMIVIAVGTVATFFC
jgi:hypothetical protein